MPTTKRNKKASSWRVYDLGTNSWHPGILTDKGKLSAVRSSTEGALVFDAEFALSNKNRIARQILKDRLSSSENRLEDLEQANRRQRFNLLAGIFKPRQV